MPTDHDTAAAEIEAEAQAFREARGWDQFQCPENLAISIAAEAC